MAVATADRDARSEDDRDEEAAVVSLESLRRLMTSASVLADKAEEQVWGVEGVE